MDEPVANAYNHVDKRHGLGVIALGLALQYSMQQKPDIQPFSVDIDFFDDHCTPFSGTCLVTRVWPELICWRVSSTRHPMANRRDACAKNRG